MTEQSGWTERLRVPKSGWEYVCSYSNGEWYTERLRVPNGWIYQTVTALGPQGAVFVPSEHWDTIAQEIRRLCVSRSSA